MLSGAFFTFYYWDTYVGITYRYRWVVEVETPQGIRTGASVIEVNSKYYRGGMFSGPYWHTKFKGEAVAVDLPNGQTLFVLLDKAKGLLYSYKPYLNPPELRAELRGNDFDKWYPKFVRAAKKLGIVAEVPYGKWLANEGRREGYPRFVRFRDVNDPRTVQIVDPANLAAAFGTGYTFQRMTVQTTNDEVTWGEMDRIPLNSRAWGGGTHENWGEFMDWYYSVPLNSGRRITSSDFNLNGIDY